MKEYKSLKKMLKYIMQYYTINENKAKTSYLISEIIANIGQDTVYNFLKWHKLLPLLPPNDVLDTTHIQSYVHERNKKLLALSRIITETFKKENIDFCFLKGISLVVSIYNNIENRVFNDIDILVAKKDLSKADTIISSMGFVHGDVINNNIVLATKAQIRYQRLYTHELYRFVKKHDDMYYLIDTNHLFSWVGYEPFSKKTTLEDIIDDIIMYPIEDYEIPILDIHYQFVHLCSHFFNEANYFALDTLYKGEDPKEIRLFRLFDICFLISNNSLNISKIHSISKTQECIFKVEYVLSLISYLFGNIIDLSNFEEFYNISSMEKSNTYYLKNGLIQDWPIPFEDRLFEINVRNDLRLIY